MTRSDKHKSALLLMKALAVSKVSNTAIDDLIIGDFSLLLENRIQKLRDDLIAVLDQKGIELILMPSYLLSFRRITLQTLSVVYNQSFSGRVFIWKKWVSW